MQVLFLIALMLPQLFALVSLMAGCASLLTDVVPFNRFGRRRGFRRTS
jgi:hypothetical protein